MTFYSQLSLIILAISSIIMVQANWDYFKSKGATAYPTSPPSPKWCPCLCPACRPPVPSIPFCLLFFPVKNLYTRISCNHPTLPLFSISAVVLAPVQRAQTIYDVTYVRPLNNENGNNTVWTTDAGERGFSSSLPQRRVTGTETPKRVQFPCPAAHGLLAFAALERFRFRSPSSTLCETHTIVFCLGYCRYHMLLKRVTCVCTAANDRTPPVAVGRVQKSKRSRSPSSLLARGRNVKIKRKRIRKN